MCHQEGDFFVRKKVLSLLLAFCMIVMPFTVAYADGGADAKTAIQVTDSSELHEAIADASNGQTIYLKDGTYEGTFSIEGKALTLVGESRDGVVLQFDPAYKQTKTFNSGSCYPILFSDSDLTVKNLTVKGPTDQHHGIDGILAEADLIMDSVTVQDIRCTADGGYVCGVQYGKGILVEGSGAVSITNCSVIDFQKTAIDLNTTGEVVIDQNVIEGVGPQTIIAQNGIVIRQGSATITGNKISNLSYTADNEWKYGSTGIYPLEGVTALTVTGNTLEAVDDPIYTGALKDDVKDKADISDNIIEKLPAPFAVNGSLYATLAEAVEKASDGDTITIAEGVHEIGSVRISKCVNIEGAGAGKTILNGAMDYTGSASSATVSVSNLTMQATSATSNHALNFGALQNSAIDVENCAFTGYEFAIGVNSTATDNTLNVSGTTFTSTGCAVGVKAGKAGNQVVFGENVVVNDGYAIQAFGAYEDTASGYGFNAFYNSYESYQTDIADGKFDNPDYDALNDPTGSKTIIVTPSMDLNAAIAKANDGDTLQFTSGTFDLSGLNAITKRVNLVGAGEDKTVFQGHVTYQFSEDQNGNTVSVSGIRFEAAASDKVQGLQFRGDKPNNGYNLNIEVEDCTFDGWNFGITMNSHANGYAMTVSGCDFSDSLYAVSYNLDTKTQGQIANNTLSFGEGNIISANGYAVQEFNNDYSTPDSTIDNTYQTIADFEAGTPTISSHIYYVSDSTGLQAAIDNAADGEATTIVCAPGTYDGVIFFRNKNITVKAQYPAYQNGEKEEDKSKLSRFTGTFNTSEGTTDDAFREDQTVVIEGFAFSGDGLKVGNTNYNTVGNLEVRNCTMEFGENLAKEDVTRYNQHNYFVKLSGNKGAPYAAATVENNYISGEPAQTPFAITPIQLWDVKKAVVRNNVIDLQNAEKSQAINISMLDPKAEITVSGNKITDAGAGGIYVTTWMLGGTDCENGETKFTGVIDIRDNTMQVAEDEETSKYPIFLGYENNAAKEDNAYGIVAGQLIIGGNTNNGEKVQATLGRPENAESIYYVATFVSNNETIGRIAVTENEENQYPVTLLPLEDTDTHTFVGWYSDVTENTYTFDEQQSYVVSLQEDRTTFTAVWEEIDDGDDDKPSGSGSSSSDDPGSALPLAPGASYQPGEPSDPTQPGAPSGFVSDTTNDLTVNGTYQFRITSLDGTIPFLTVDNANFRVEFASQEGNDFFFKIHAQGAAGSTTVVSVNGVRLLTATVGGSATGVISDTTAPFTVKKGETYQFRLTASERPSFAAGSASFTVEYAGQIGSDYFYKVYAAGNVGDGCGFYINGEASPVAVATIA